jgi:hypothetical protein
MQYTKMPDNLKRPNQYRRAFEWSVSSGDKEARLTQLEGSARLASSDFPNILEDFLETSRKRSENHTAMARLQMHMLEELLIQEGAVKHYRQKLKEMGAFEDQEPLDAPRIPRSASPEVKFLQRELFFYRLYANAIRAIGDGIAWRALKHDRAVTRLMAEHPTKQQVSSEGTIQEMREWSLQFDSGSGFAILNALTNCLAIGDITVVRDDDSVEIIEVKSSNSKSGRKVRQKHRMEEVVTLLADGGGRTQDKQIRIEILAIEPETALDQLGELLQEAEKSGWASRKISNYLYVEAFDLLSAVEFSAIKPKLAQAKAEVVGTWESQGDFVLDMLSQDVIPFTPNCAPFSVFPFDSKTCVELLIGSKYFITYLNMDAVEREFEYRGWEIEKSQKQLMLEGNKEQSLLVRKGPFHAAVPPADFGRIQFELLRPKSLIEALDSYQKQAPTGNEGFLLTLFEGEHNIWR